MKLVSDYIIEKIADNRLKKLKLTKLHYWYLLSEKEYVIAYKGKIIQGFWGLVIRDVECGEKPRKTTFQELLYVRPDKRIFVMGCELIII